MFSKHTPVPSNKFPIISLIVCFAAILVLCRLGAWQIERLAWKNDLQQNLDEAFAKDSPDPFDKEDFEKLQKGQVIRGTVEGRLNLAQAVLFHGRIEGGKSVMTLVAPLTLSPSQLSVSVEVGCSANADAKTLETLKAKDVNVSGVMRVPSWTFVTPQNIPAQGEWWRLNPLELETYWALQNMQSGVITAENTDDLVSGFTPCIVEKQLRNDHQSYAIFWFSMAAVLAVMWCLRFLKPYLQSA